MRVDRPTERPEDLGESADRPEARPQASDLRDANGLNAAEYTHAWNEKMKSEEAEQEQADEERPRRDVDLRDSNGMTAAELRFLRNKRIDEAEAARAEEAAEAEEPDTLSDGGDEDLPDAIRAARDQPKEYAEQRAAELQALLPEARRGRITMGVGVGTDTGGGTRVVIGTSEDNGYLRKPLQLAFGEEIAEGRGHAETSILDHMTDRDIRPSHIAAGRPICPPCADRVAAAGAEPASPLKNAKEDQ